VTVEETSAAETEDPSETGAPPPQTGGEAAIVRANVTAFRAEGNASMMGGWTD